MLFVLLVLLVNAQTNKRTNFWYFTDSIGLNFNSGAPIVDSSGMANSYHGGTSLCVIQMEIYFFIQMEKKFGIKNTC